MTSKDKTDHPRNGAPHYMTRTLPPGLESLGAMALEVRWSWSHEADALWQRVDPELWDATGNPWLILQSVSLVQLQELAQDHSFIAELRHLEDSRHRYFNRRTWFDATHGTEGLKPVAYFSMEFGLSEALPIYAGGLGILAGDHLKTASDLGVPLVGIGLLYQQGYFRQAIGADHNQVAVYPYNNPAMLPVTPVRGSAGEWVRIALELPGRKVYLRAWQVVVGTVMLYLLDSNDPLNLPVDRGITAELYAGGGPEVRLQQEIVLGIGGFRLLTAVGVDPEVCHLNEGHAAFVIMERARAFMAVHKCSFEVALRATRAGNVFTTHTPVEAGFDRFPAELIGSYFDGYADELGIRTEDFLAMGRAAEHDSDEAFNMAYLAARGCNSINAVSELHAQVSRRIFHPLFPRWPEAEVPIGYVTNGVHVPSWDSQHADKFWTETCGKERWASTFEHIEQAIGSVGDEQFWDLRTQNRKTLVEAIRRRISRDPRNAGSNRAVTLLNADTMTLGLARRFTGYKRANLLLRDPARLDRILNHPQRPVQLLVAGKAHPLDGIGNGMVREWVEYSLRPEVRDKVLFMPDYDIAVASELVQGVDLWINTPRRPWEACGTSGMKLLVNGGLNLSELDGWWAEAYTPEVGWALGDRVEHGDDPELDAREAEELYRILEQEAVPAFYRRDARGIPGEWVGRIRASMGRLAPRFSSNRMMREYTEQSYLPAARDYRARVAENGALGAGIEEWHKSLGAKWATVSFGNLNSLQAGDFNIVRLQVFFGELDPQSVGVELFANGDEDGVPVRVPMESCEKIDGGAVYEATISKERPVSDYTPRAIPKFQQTRVPLEANQILWFR